MKKTQIIFFFLLIIPMVFSLDYITYNETWDSSSNYQESANDLQNITRLISTTDDFLYADIGLWYFGKMDDVEVENEDIIVNSDGLLSWNDKTGKEIGKETQANDDLAVYINFDPQITFDNVTTLQMEANVSNTGNVHMCWLFVNDNDDCVLEICSSGSSYDTTREYCLGQTPTYECHSAFSGAVITGTKSIQSQNIGDCGLSTDNIPNIKRGLYYSRGNSGTPALILDDIAFVDIWNTTNNIPSISSNYSYLYEDHIDLCINDSVSSSITWSFNTSLVQDSDNDTVLFSYTSSALPKNTSFDFMTKYSAMDQLNGLARVFTGDFRPFVSGGMKPDHSFLLSNYIQGNNCPINLLTDFSVGSIGLESLIRKRADLLSKVAFDHTLYGLGLRNGCVGNHTARFLLYDSMVDIDLWLSLYKLSNGDDFSINLETSNYENIYNLNISVNTTDIVFYNGTQIYKAPYSTSFLEGYTIKIKYTEDNDFAEVIFFYPNGNESQINNLQFNFSITTNLLPADYFTINYNDSEHITLGGGYLNGIIPSKVWNETVPDFEFYSTGHHKAYIYASDNVNSVLDRYNTYSFDFDITYCEPNYVNTADFDLLGFLRSIVTPSMRSYYLSLGLIDTAKVGLWWVFVILFFSIIALQIKMSMSFGILIPLMISSLSCFIMAWFIQFPMHMVTFGIIFAFSVAPKLVGVLLGEGE